MLRRHRLVHRRLWFALVVLIPAALLALAATRPMFAEKPAQLIGAAGERR